MRHPVFLPSRPQRAQRSSAKTTDALAANDSLARIRCRGVGRTGHHRRHDPIRVAGCVLTAQPLLVLIVTPGRPRGRLSCDLTAPTAIQRTGPGSPIEKADTPSDAAPVGKPPPLGRLSRGRSMYCSRLDACRPLLGRQSSREPEPGYQPASTGFAPDTWALPGSDLDTAAPHAARSACS
jgi:hypothetical protein